MAMGKLGDAKVKARIVYKYNCIGVIGKYVLLTQPYVGQHCTQMCHHLHYAHNGKIADMFYHRSTHTLHEVATPKTHFGLRVVAVYCFHKVGSMQVARGFARYNVVLHKKNNPIV